MEVVQKALAAYAMGDADGFVESMTDDAVVRPSAFISGQTEYRGRAAARQGVRDGASILSEHGNRLRLHPYATYTDAADPRRVLSLGRLTIIRSDGGSFGSDVAYLWTLDGDQIAGLDTWLDHDQGLAQLAAPVEAGRPRLALAR